MQIAKSGVWKVDSNPAFIKDETWYMLFLGQREKSSWFQEENSILIGGSRY